MATTEVATRPSSSPSSASSLSSSVPEGTETSTMEYEQEPWIEYRHRVENLCQKLWPQKKSLMSRLLNCHLTTRLRANQWLNTVLPVATIPLIERLKGGDYNRITGISIPTRGNRGESRLILRTPREKEYKRLDREVALLNYVRQKSTIPVAKVASHDFTENNPLQSPYVIQHRLPGKDLDPLWYQLNHSQRCSVARELGQVVQQLVSMESNVTGILETATSNNSFAIIVPFELEDNCREPIDDVKVDALKRSRGERETTVDFFNNYLNRWRAFEVARHFDDQLVDCVKLMDSLLNMVREMNDLGLLEPTTICLCHVDLEPRNIMAHIRPDQSIEVTGILDWDEAIFAPNFVSCKPPKWIWSEKGEQEAIEDERGDIEFWPYEARIPESIPSTPEKKELKQIFEEYAGPEYARLAYAEHFRILRVLFLIATLGLLASERIWAVERILRDWERIRGTFQVKSDQ